MCGAKLSYLLPAESLCRFVEPDSLLSSCEPLCCVREPALLLPSSGAAVLCVKPDSVPVLLTESLCYQSEPGSATFLAESLSCVWSEPGSVLILSHRGALCCSVLCIYCGGAVELRVEESGVPAVEPAGSVYIVI